MNTTDEEPMNPLPPIEEAPETADEAVPQAGEVPAPAMPAKKASTTLNAGRAAPPAVTCSNACGNSSTNDTYTMTPAENPNAVERNLVLVRRAKKAMALPMPVLSPASRVSTRAKRNGDDIVGIYDWTIYNLRLSS